MDFLDLIAGLDLDRLEHAMAASTDADVDRALLRSGIADRDIAALLSPAAARRLEDLASKSAELTRKRFGRTMQLYAPIYLSNECVNRCVYCGFSHGLPIGRSTLTVAQAQSEAELLRASGFRHLLLVSGEHPRYVDVGYLESVAISLHRRFDSLSVEIGPLDTNGYARLFVAGIDGLTLYQETYQPQIYRRVHPGGPKAHYGARLRAIERGGDVGFRTLGIGALLGLAPFRLEALLLALHGRYLARRFWRSRIAVSFPRIRPVAGGFQAPCPVSDADLVQMVCALRLALPDAELVLSTREPPAVRDGLMALGITRMSAGSRTQPGGYEGSSDAGEQFAVDDRRTPAEVASAIAERGLDPVWKDFDRCVGQGPLT